jgi:hypothetical protein
VSQAFKFAASFSKPAKSALTGFQNWRALCCWLSEREFFIGNISGGYKNRR